MTDREKWQAFTDSLSTATWNLAKVFHFIGRITGRVAEELGYEDDYPFGRRPLDRTPDEVNDTHALEYPEHDVEYSSHMGCDDTTDYCLIGKDSECPHQQTVMGYWFQID